MGKYYHCPYCTKKYLEKQALYNHIQIKHSEYVTEDFPPSRLYFNFINKKDSGKCVICGKETTWNEVTERYNRFCSDKCKDTYVKEFQKRMIKVYGKTNAELLKDPERQKKMLANRKISGEYEWSDKSAKITYTGTYELDFLKFLDLFMHFDSSDVIAPAPQVFYYNDNGNKRFYIPDFYIPSINTLIEIKDGQDNKAKYENRLERDAKKEKFKDDIMRKQNQYNYVKVVNKDYSIFLNFLMKLKDGSIEENKEKFTPVIDISEAFNLAVESLKPKHILNEELSQKDLVLSEYYYKDKNTGIENCLVTLNSGNILNNKPLRGKSEVLIVKGNQIMLAFKDKNMKGGYSVPGGSWEKGVPKWKTAEKEVQEEVRINLKPDLKYYGQYVKRLNEPPSWCKENIEKKYWFYGYLINLYVGEYKGNYTGNIDNHNKDDMIKKAKFYDIDKVYNKLTPEHKEALDQYLNYRSKIYNEDATFMNSSGNMGSFINFNDDEDLDFNIEIEDEPTIQDHHYNFIQENFDFL